MPQFDAIMYCTEAPCFELRDGMVYIGQRVGKHSNVERVVSRHTFLKSYRAAGKIVAAINAGRDNVVAIPAAGDEPDEEEALAH